MLNSTPAVIAMFSIVMFGMILLPLLNSLVLYLFSRILKFNNRSFRTAFFCSLTNFGIFIGLSSTFSILFINRIQQQSAIFSLVSLLASFVAGIFVVRKFYKESIAKSLLALFLTGLVMLVLFIIIAIVGSLILGPYLLKGGVLK